MSVLDRNNLSPIKNKEEKRVSIRYCIAYVLTGLVIAFALILIVSSFYNKEQDIAKDQYTFEYGEDALAKLKASINADSIDINFQDEGTMGYPKCGRYTGTAVKGEHIETFTVLIQDTVAPEFTSSVKNLEYVVGEGSTESVLSNFSAYDISGAVEMNIQGDIDFKKAGSYNITVSATDNSRNTSTVDCVVEIKDTENTSGSEDVYDTIQGMADSNSEDYVQYTEDRPINKESHLLIDVIGVDLDIIDQDPSGEYFAREFAEDDICIFTSGLSEPGKGGSVLIGGSGVGSLRGLPSVNIDNTITMYWYGVKYQYKVVTSEECRIDGNSLISLSTGENILSTTDNNILQIYSTQQDKDTVWFVKAEMVG